MSYPKYKRPQHITTRHPKGEHAYFSPASGSVLKDRTKPPLNERLINYLRGTIENNGPMTAEEVAALLGFSEPTGRGARKAQQYLDAL